MAMPGGLSRVAASRDSAIVSMQRGGGSKDTWVLSDRPVIPITLLAPQTATPRRERRATDLSSRVADNLFWLGRHAERAEHTVRLLRSTITRIADDSPEFAAMLQVLVRLNLLPETFAEPGSSRDVEQDLISVLFARQPPSALQATLNELRRLTSMARDRLSIDTSR